MDMNVVLCASTWSVLTWLYPEYESMKYHFVAQRFIYIKDGIRISGTCNIKIDEVNAYTPIVRCLIYQNHISSHERYLIFITELAFFIFWTSSSMVVLFSLSTLHFLWDIGLTARSMARWWHTTMVFMLRIS